MEAMEARNRTLPDWFTKLRTHQIVLPRFQRYEAWSHGQVASLLTTVLQGLPAGAVLTLEVGENEPFVSRPIQGAPSHGDRVAEHLLDGQQRLTALWRSLTDGYEDRTYLVRLGPDEETGEPHVIESQARWTKGGRKYPLWVDDPVELWQRRYLPVSLLRPDQEAEEAATAWARRASGGDGELTMQIFQFASRLRAIFAAYNIPFLSLPRTTDKETALNVFIRMNTSATPLSNYDIVVAQVEESTEISLHDFADMLLEKAPNAESYIRTSDLMLQVSALIQDREPTKTTFLSPDFSEKMIENWELTEDGIQKAILFLEEEGIMDARRLPSDVVVYPLAALWAMVPDGLDAEGQARTLLRRYLWRSFFTERYERTSATRALVDYRNLRDLIAGETDAIPLAFNDDEYPLPSVEALAVAGWPRRKDRVARGLLALSLRAGGLDFADGSRVTREHMAKREYHHLFPTAWLRQKGYKQADCETAINCALVTWKTNRALSQKSPSEYVEDRRDKASLGEEEIRSRIESHLIPYDELVSDSFEIFRRKRSEMLHEAMVRVCSGMS